MRKESGNDWKNESDFNARKCLLKNLFSQTDTHKQHLESEVHNSIRVDPDRSGEILEVVGLILNLFAAVQKVNISSKAFVEE